MEWKVFMKNIDGGIRMTKNKMNIENNEIYVIDNGKIIKPKLLISYKSKRMFYFNGDKIVLVDQIPIASNKEIEKNVGKLLKKTSVKKSLKRIIKKQNENK